ncbi:MAG: DNA-3-methyladenine glycosylase [Patescibacteria group bacterium]|nr:DNA-3-methyladenine glycosylase [Patescibacteria group bacterium]
MTCKLTREFYLKPAVELAPDFLGKFLVYNSPKGLVSGKISEVEAYPAFTDNVSHGNKRTKRTNSPLKK